MPATTPMTSAPRMFTEEQDGVMATRPATMPDAAPRLVGLPSRNFSTSSQPSIAAEVAKVVVRNVEPARPLEPTAEPALKPNQPNHSRPAPSITKGRLCGRIGDLGQPLRLPSTMHSARPAAPALMCTAVPPAKSMACSLFAIQPPWCTRLPAASVTLKSNTQWQTGK